MPRPTAFTPSKIAEGRMSPASPRWAGINSSGSSQGSMGTTSRRGATPVSSPRAYAPPGGGTPRGSAGRDSHGLRSTMTNPSERSTTGSSKGRRVIEVDNPGEREDVGADSGRIRVAVRVRPFSEKEKLTGTRCVISMAGNQTKILDPAYFDSEDDASSTDDRSMWERTFSFDHSFWSHSSDRVKGGRASGEGGGNFSNQADVHQALGNFLLDNACRGFNCSLFAYGQTGSGKTYTMLGDSSDLTSAAGEGTAGLIPRICVELFQRFGLTGGDQGSGGDGAAKAFHGSGQASVKVSFCEIYNEQVRDLFCQGGSGHGLRVREHPTKGAFVEGLSARPVSCYQQVQRLLEDGMSARATAATAMNEVSSRSHAIFTIHITVTVTTKLSGGGRDDRGLAVDGEAEEDISSRTSKICLVDLAGSERANATGAKGDRLREAANINKSLSTLGDVIKALAKRADSGRGSGGGAIGGSSNNESFIPYRNSMLTWLLKDSIGGNSKTVMLAAISPVADAYQETMSTLRYVERAKEIVNSVAINDANANPLIGKLREEVRVLQELLESREATIAEHEGNVVMLTAALERARAGDDDKVLRALTDADELEAALLAEKRERDRIAAAAAKEVEALEQKHTRALQEETNRHAADFEECLERHEGEIRRIREEATQMLALEIGLAKDQATEERGAVLAELEQKAELQRVAAAEAHAEEMDALVNKHRAAADRALEEANSAAARAAESAAAEVAELRKRHAAEMTESVGAAEASKLEEIRQFREEVEREREVARQELIEARRVEEAERDAEMQASIAAAKAMVEETKEAALKELRDQYDASSVRLSEAHAIEVKSAVAEVVKRLRAEHEDAMAAAEATNDKAINEARLEEAKRLEKENGARHENALSNLRATHEEQLQTLSNAHDEVIQKGRHDADGQLEALREESARKIQAAEESHREQLVSAKNEQDVELRRTVDAERAKAEAAAATAVEALMAEAEAARTAMENKHREDVRTVGERLDAEIQAVVADSERREKEAIAELRREHGEIEVAHQAQFGRLSEEHAAGIAALKAEYEERLRKEVSSTAALAESRRKADVEAADLRASERFAAYEAEAAANLAAERKHREEIGSREKQAKAEIAELEARAASVIAAVEGRREEREGELAELRRNNDEALRKVRADADSRLSAAQVESEREVMAINDSHQARLASARIEHEKELRSVIEAEKVRAKSEGAVAIEALKAELEGARICQEQKYKEDVEEVRKVLSRSIAEAQREHEASLEASEARHRAALADSDARHRDEMEVAVRGAKEELASTQAEAAVAIASQDARHQEEMRSSEQGFEEEVRRRKAEVQELHRALAQGEDKIKEISETVERKLAEYREKNAEQEASNQAELARLRDEHSAAAAKTERQRTAELAEARRRYESSVDLMREEMGEEKAKFVSTHLLDMRKVKEGRVAEVQRVLREAEERRAAQEAKASAEMNEAKLTHLRDLQVAASSAEEARKVELAAVNDALERATSELKAEIGRLEDQHQEQLRKIAGEREAENSTRSTAASDLHAKALAELTEAHEKHLHDTLQAERSSHAAALSAAEAKEAAAAEAAILATEQVTQQEKNLRETQESEHRLTVDALENAHRTAMEELRETGRKDVEELERKVEAAQAAAEDAQASADELATRANALDEMLKASVGSNELELAGHRSRVAQLQGFVARREAASSLTPAVREDKNTNQSGLSTAATRSLQQRVTDLRAIAAAVGCSDNAKAGGGVETGLAEFASTGMVEGLTVEKYAEELEVVLVRATVEAAAARQDHLEADMQCQSITRQLVGLKLVHAQLRECLEDTQVKLEHKSQSAARRLLNSAARLAYEFAKPDRASSRTPGSPKSTKPKAMSRQNSGARSPLSRTRGGALRRNKTPERGRERQGVATEQVAVDFNATL